MERNKRVLALILSMALAFTFVFPVSAATEYSSNWKQDAAGKWFVQKADGTVIKNSWFCDDYDKSDTKWYILGQDGFMLEAPLVRDKTGAYFSIETNHNGCFGMMRNKSGVYDGINITINETYNSTYGAILNQSAIDELSKKYGVVNVDIDNANIVFASKLVETVASGSSASSSRRVSPGTDISITVPSENGTYRYGAATLVVSGNRAEYTNLSGTGQNVKLTSAGQDIVINAPLDEFVHYGTAGEIIIKAVANASYYGYADAESMEINTGHISLNSNIDKILIDAKEDLTIDINQDAVVPEIDIVSEDEKAVDLTIGGDVKNIKSETGALTITVEPTAKQVPILEFIGDDAVAAYEARIKQKLKEKKEIPVYLTYNGKTETYMCKTEYTSKFGTEVIAQNIGDFEGGGRTFEKEVIIDGDFGKICFIGCHFKGDVINRGSEQTIVQFIACTFDENSECRIENNGRKITIDDLVPKFMFIMTNPVNVECEASNGSVVSAETDSPIMYNLEKHTISEALYYVDQRPDAYTTSIQEYEGQPAGIYYYGEFNSLDGRKIINLSVYDADSTVYRAYVTVNEEMTEYDPSTGRFSNETFRFASASEAEYTGEVYVNAPYNTVTFDGIEFGGTVYIRGLYAKVRFKECDFNNNQVVIQSPEVKIEFIDCKNIVEPNTDEEIDEEYYLPPDGPITE